MPLTELYERHVCPFVTELALRGGPVRRQRAALLSEVEGRVLEIGFGTGLNLEHYARERVESLAVVDPAEGMHARAKERLAHSPIPVEVHAQSAERLPFADESFDAVVCTFTLCTIPDPVAAVAEVRRVLAPGGVLHLIEHVGSLDPKIRRWQDRLNPVQRVLGCGCNLNRDVDRILEAAGFEQPQLERFMQAKTPRLFREHVRGRVVKPG
jgi:ubiquinone/menaquinone biosynthesis C-methylase UbiE